MRIDCSKAQELLADDHISDDVQNHVKECFRCSDIATGLAMLDEGLNNSPRHSPSRELNDLVLLKLHQGPSLPHFESNSSRALDGFWLKITCLAITACVCFSVIDLFRVDRNLQSAENITTPLMALASKSIFDLIQLGIVIAGLASLGFSSVKKVLVFAILFLSMIMVEAVKFLL